MLTAIFPPQFMFGIHAGMLAELPVALGVTTRQIGLTLRGGAMLSPAALAVLDAICGVAQEFPHYIDSSRTDGQEYQSVGARLKLDSIWTGQSAFTKLNNS